MKIENEPLSGHSAFLSKRDSPQFRFMNRNVNITELEVIKNQKGIFANLQENENNETSLASEINEKDVHLNTPKLECAMIVDDLAHGAENKIIDTPSLCKLPSSKANRSGKTDVRTEKIIRPCELPELSVCYKDNTYAFKDINLDEKVLIKDKLITGNGNEGSVARKESDSEEFLSPDGSLQSSENDVNNDSQELKSSLESNFVRSGALGGTDSSPTNKIRADVEPGEVFNAIPLSQDFSSQNTLKSFLQSPDCNDNEFDQSTAKISYTEVADEIPVSSSACNSKSDCTTNASEFKYCKLDNGVDEAQQGQGESSMSIAGPSSGRITYSGPMLVYSGSVSIRSDSSSTRSFAFPILQPEWHTSPIKMAKPDRRQYRKQKGWKQSFICCRF